MSANAPAFDQRYVRELPGTYEHVRPTPLANPHWVCWNAQLARELNVPFDADAEALRALSGNGLFAGSEPVAEKYAGHQFGVWNPDLGDGRGLLLGEWADANGKAWEFHLKGAGKTPFSRFGDGRAVLRSSIREMLASEALHALGIPTTRALALVGSDEPVRREQIETAAMLTRVTPSHIRFGHFEWFAYSNQPEQVAALVEHCLVHHFPNSRSAAEFFTEVVERTARLIAHWMAYGFCHGVMNTDNMSILGETFDFGPYAFLDATIPDFICNHTDAQGRYAFHQQPGIAFWNLQCLAQALSSQVSSDDLKAALNRYADTYNDHFLKLMGERLGLATVQENDQQLISDWMHLLASERRDFHHSFRALADRAPDDWAQLDDDAIDRPAFQRWRSALAERRQNETDQGIPLAQARNPISVLRTHLAQAVIDDVKKGSVASLEEYLLALQSPFERREDWQRWSETPPIDYQAAPLSCSS
ncbi:protein adenylyltransferase SelO [Saccharospirillum mangrovi]|uniref:protein adenylyltransferase SelO n=1 Tax=Saccharospirillum mangrovi TaxID=2161747 RepID=UPI000D3D5595|nr:YdiU family protein [Saccharospirillum mangrovi]